MIFTRILRQMSSLSSLKQPKEMYLKEIVDNLLKFAPLTLAEQWDNVGLLIDSITTKPIRKILLTNDLTEDVVNEAINTKSQLIISYHPNIFQGLKSVTSRTWKERIVVECIKNEISVFSPHTSWDSVEGGVNDWLANAFQYDSTKPIKENVNNSKQGAGRFLTLKHPISVKIALESIKNHIHLPHLRLALARNATIETEIKTVALCAGSGSSVLNGATADLYLTGEMLHHDILDATQRDINVILCNHSDSERGFLVEFQAKLQKEILAGSMVDIIVSKYDKDPLVTV